MKVIEKDGYIVIYNECDMIIHPLTTEISFISKIPIFVPEPEPSSYEIKDHDKNQESIKVHVTRDYDVPEPEPSYEIKENNGNTEYYYNRKLIRKDLKCGDIEYYHNGKLLYTEYKPKIKYYRNGGIQYRKFETGLQEYYDLEKVCIKRIFPSGDTEWYNNGDIVRIKYADGAEEWYNEGKLTKYKNNDCTKYYDQNESIIKITKNGKIVYDQEFCTKCKSLRREGLSAKDIASKYNTSITTIYTKSGTGYIDDNTLIMDVPENYQDEINQLMDLFENKRR